MFTYIDMASTVDYNLLPWQEMKTCGSPNETLFQLRISIALPCLKCRSRTSVKGGAVDCKCVKYSMSLRNVYELHSLRSSVLKRFKRLH